MVRGSSPPCTRATMKRTRFGPRRSGSYHPRRSSASATKPTSGRRGRPDSAGRTARSSSIRVHKRACLTTTATLAKTAAGTSRSGTSSSSSTTARPTAPSSRCRRRTSTPARASSGLRRCCRGSPVIPIAPTCSNRWSRRSSRCRERNTATPRRPTSRSVSSPSTRARPRS